MVMSEALDDIREDIASCKNSIDRAITDGTPPNVILDVVADAIGLDMSNIPPMFRGMITNSMMSALATRADA
jgi:hypothetical protein